MKRLYKGGKTSPLLHDIDATDWLTLGWSEDKPVTNAIVVAELQDMAADWPAIAHPHIKARLAELQTLATDWRAISAIAKGHGITRPADGWDAAVLPILVAEYGQIAAEEVFTSPEVAP